MALGHNGAVVRQFRTLFGVGVVGGLSDRQLLERFLDRGEGGEAAFEALVTRHGPMVMGVCRQLLGRPDDAEDAFQATFLVLVRRADSIRKRDSLASWLYGVARRIALRAKSQEASRRLREGLGEPGRATLSIEGPEADELRKSLHAEIDRLPEKYRAPVVLIDLEGRTHAEAAEQLRWPIGTVSGRLFRARELLRDRITRRGLALGGTVAAIVGLGGRSASAAGAIKPGLADAAVRTAIAFARGRSLLDVPARVLALSAEGTTVAAPLKLASAAGVVLALGLGLASGGKGVTLSPRVETATTPIASRAPAVESMATPGHGTKDRPSRPLTNHLADRDAAKPQDAKSPAASGPETADIPGHGTPQIVLRGHADAITALAYAPDGKTLASGSRDWTVKLWDVTTWEEKSTFVGHRGAILSLAFSADSKTLASSSEDRTVRLWDVTTGRTMLTLGDSPDEASLAALGRGPKAPDRGGHGRDRRANGPGRPAPTDA